MKKKKSVRKGEPLGEELSNETLEKVRGGTSVPQTDDQVLVGSESGDTTSPVVIGGLWNGKTKTSR